tara:strand:- start:1772 stop:2155 length:384 start_codon:yes stop_codon:yes gene_type:complete
MGKMNLRVQPLFIDPVGDGTIGGLKGTDGTCSTQFSVIVKTTSSVWLSWGVLDTGTVLDAALNPAVNGQTITSNTTFSLLLVGYQAPNQQVNDQIVTTTFYLHDVEGGTLVDSKEFIRFSNGNLCVF